MESNAHPIQKSHFKIVGKKLIFTVGTVLLAFANVNAATVSVDTKSDAKTIGLTVNDTAVAKPESINGNEKITAAAIAEDSKIIESESVAVAPLLPGKSQEEIIADDNLVTENASKEIFPLDFKKINGKKKSPKAPIKSHSERLFGSL